MKLFFDKEYELDTQKKINYYEYLYGERTVLTDPLFQPREDALTKNSVVIGTYSKLGTRCLRKYLDFEEISLLTDEQSAALNEFVPELAIQEIDGKKEVTISNFSEFEKINNISLDSLAVFAVREAEKSKGYIRKWSYRNDMLRNFNGSDPRKGSQSKIERNVHNLDRSFFKDGNESNRIYSVLFNYSLRFREDIIDNYRERGNYKMTFKISKKEVNGEDVYYIPDIVDGVLNMKLFSRNTSNFNKKYEKDGSIFTYTINILIGKMGLDRNGQRLIPTYKNQRRTDQYRCENQRKDSSYLSNSFDIITRKENQEFKYNDLILTPKSEKTK